MTAPPRLAEGVPNNLPTPVSSFVGRRREVEEVADMLGRSRLVTVAGGAGLGKTRLALQVAASCASAYPGGVWLVELASIGDDALVPHAVASVLGLREEWRDDVTAGLVTTLRSRRLLLVLDNCEQVVTGVARTGDALLRACPELSILATSREAFGMAGEAVVTLGPLAVPESLQTSPEWISHYDSVQLFVERASAQTRFDLDAETAPDVAEICRRLDGIPLAIELAAARSGVLSPTEILLRLGDRFRFLRRGNRTALPRHQTLEAALDWSDQLLSPAERSLLRRLSVFAGAFSADAAERVCSGRRLAGEDVFALLEHLVSKSLVMADVAPGGARYRMLETVRQYAAAKLDPGLVEGLRDAHAEWYLQVAERAERELAAPDQQAWLERLEAEHDNLRAALDWLLTSGRSETALRLATALALFWRLRGHWSEGQRWLRLALEAQPSVSSSLRAKALWGRALLASVMADFDEAIASGEEALELSRQVGDTSGTARALNVLGFVWAFQHPPKALPMLEESTALARQCGDEWCLGESLALAGQVAMVSGNPDSARRLFRESLILARASGDRRALAKSLLGSGWAGGSGDAASAVASLEEGLSIARSLGVPYELADALIIVGGWSEQHGDLERAGELLEEALSLAQEVGSPLLTARSLRALGSVAVLRGDVDPAEKFLEQAAAIARESQLRYVLVRCLLRRGQLALREVDPAAAHASWSEALEVAGDSSDKVGRSTALYGLAILARRDSDDERAGRLLHQALTLAAESADATMVVESLVALAELAIAQKRFTAAARLLGAAIAADERAPRRILPAPRREACLVEVQEALGEKGLEEVLAQGRGMSLEEAVAYASRGRGTRNERAARGWASLTKTERQVVELVAEGLTNREIAERLYVSRFTVGSHMSHIFAKLGLSSRRELARQALDRQG